MVRTLVRCSPSRWTMVSVSEVALEDRALLKFLPQRMGIGKIAVMGDGQAATREIRENGLDVGGPAAAGGGITVMADGKAAFEISGRRPAAAKGVAHQALAWRSAMSKWRLS